MVTFQIRIQTHSSSSFPNQDSNSQPLGLEPCDFDDHAFPVCYLAGVGDFRIAEVESLPDPCPTPDMEKRRSLNQKERFVYAPMSGVGGVLYDKDAVYIDVGGSHHFHSDNTEVRLQENSCMCKTVSCLIQL